MAPLIIRFGLWKTLGHLLLSALMCAFMAGAALLGDRENERFAMVVASLMLIPFSLILIMHVTHLIGGRVALILDKDGFVDNTSMFTHYRVDWQNVAGLAPFFRGAMRGIAVELKDEEAVVKRADAFTRMTMRLAQAFIGTPSAVSVAGLEKRLPETLELMRSYWQSAAKQV